jgi:probable HAF family extracellular repeat protein
MKSRALMLMTLFAALAIPLRLAAQDYRVTDLGTLGGTSSVANSVNNRGWVAGAANLPGNTAQHAVLWRRGRKTDLGTLGGPNSIANYPLNDRGEVSAYSDTATLDPFGEDFCLFGTHLICRPFVWQKRVRTPLPTLDGNNAIANEVNNRGEVGGVAETSTLDPTCVAPQVLQAEPVVWKKGKIEQLPTFPGDPDGFVTAINDNGQAIGASGQCYTALPGIHALLWQNGSATDLGNLGGTWNHIPQDINNQGQVVGFSNVPNDTATHAFLWTEEDGIQDLGTLPGDFWSFAFGINRKGQVVGQSCNMDFSVCRAFLWQDGLMRDLNSLIPAASPLSLLAAININSREEIVGQALLSTGDVHAFLATPCDKRQGDNEDCENGAEGTTGVQSATSEHPKLAVPENVRKLFRQRLGHWSRIPGL